MKPNQEPAFKLSWRGKALLMGPGWIACSTAVFGAMLLNGSGDAAVAVMFIVNLVAFPFALRHTEQIMGRVIHTVIHRAIEAAEKDRVDAETKPAA